MTHANEQIVELKSDLEWRKAFPILLSLRSDLPESTFLNRREQFLACGYTLFGLHDDGELTAVAGVYLYPHISRGIDCWVHDLVTKEEVRSKGYGTKLMRHIEQWAKEKGCSRVCVYTRIQREESQRFYETKLGYARSAVVYYQEL